MRATSFLPQFTENLHSVEFLGILKVLPPNVINVV